jgi:hypothetical protein
MYSGSPAVENHCQVHKLDASCVCYAQTGGQKDLDQRPHDVLLGSHSESW